MGTFGPPSLSAKRSEQNRNWVLATECPKVPTNFCSADFYSAGLRNFYSALTFLHLVLGVPATQCLEIPTNFYSADFCSTQFLFHIFVPHFYSTFLFRESPMCIWCTAWYFQIVLSEEEIMRIIILTILHTGRQHCHCQLVVHGQNSLRRGSTVHHNELAIK